MRGSRAIVLALGLGGCGLLEVGPASKITGIEPVSLRVSVIELGPHNPERASFPSDAPIAELLPGDRVRIEIVVVDTDGLALPDEQLDSVWLLLGGGYLEFPAFVAINDLVLDQRCEELEALTMDAACRLGEGRGSIEFTAPPLGEAQYPILWVYAAIAWNGQSADDCWEARQEGRAIATDCDFVRVPAYVGPWWWLMAHAASEGLSPWFPIENLPAAVFTQQANRAPIVDHILLGTEPVPVVDGTAGPIAVSPGDGLGLTIILDANQQFAQSYFFPISGEGDLFGVGAELTRTRVSTTGPIWFFGTDPVPTAAPIWLEVDEHAEPGLARALLAVQDDRGGETLVRVELDVQ
jgi:hypothetical protein